MKEKNCLFTFNPLKIQKLFLRFSRAFYLFFRIEKKAKKNKFTCS